MKKRLLTILSFSALCLQIFAQNVGIGTLSPDYTLDVNGTMGINDYLYHNDDSDTWIAFPQNDAFEIVTGNKRMLLADGVNNEFKLNPDGTSTNVIIVADGIEHLFHADPLNERIGIGTSTPQYLLDVSGDVRVVGDAVDHLLMINTQSDKIGVGLANPQYLFDVAGDVRVVGDAIDHLFYINSTTNKIGIGNSSPAYLVDIRGNTRITDNNGQTMLFVDAVNSRVGVGTDTPQAELDIVGHLKVGQITIGPDSPTPIFGMRSGVIPVTDNSVSGEVVSVTHTFAVPFGSPPRIIATVFNTNSGPGSEIAFTISTRDITSTEVTFFIDRTNDLAGWSDNLEIHWMAWE